MIPLNSLFGGAAYNKPLTITAANTLVWDGANFWAGTYTVVPASATNPVVNLYPASYLLTIQGVVRAMRFNVPSTTNQWTLVPASGPAVLLGTNILASLQFGPGFSQVTNADGSITVSASTNYDALGAAAAYAQANNLVTNGTAGNTLTGAFTGFLTGTSSVATVAAAAGQSTNLVVSAGAGNGSLLAIANPGSSSPQAPLTSPIYFGAGTITNNGNLNIVGNVSAAGSISGTLNASQITSGTLPPAQLPAVVLTNGKPNFAQNLSLWLNASQAYSFNPSLTDGQTVNVVDYSASNQTVTSIAAAPLFYGRALNGRPAFWLNGSSLVASNFMQGNGSNVTVAVTFKSQLAGNIYNHLWSINSGSSRAVGMYPWIDNEGNTATAYTGGEAFYDWPNSAHGGVMQRLFATHVAIYCWQNTTSNCWIYLDGMPVFDSRIMSPGTTGSGLACTMSNAYLGSDIAGGNPASAYVSDFRVYNDTLPDAYLAALNKYLCEQAGLTQPTICWDGDSKQQGIYAQNPLSSPSQLLAQQWPNYLWNVLALSGRNSTACLTNAYHWMPTVGPGLNYAANTIGCNDFGSLIGASACQAQMPITCSNILAYALCAQSNGIPLALGTITSVSWETNAFPTYDWRSNLNVYIRSLTNLAKIIDYAGLTPLGTNGAFSNAVYYANAVHENAFGYTNLVAIAAPVIQQLLSAGGPISGSSIILDGTLRNNGGALGQAIEDYYPIDTAGPYDVASTLIPGIGTYAVLGKQVNAGGQAFYWDPPRWPLFRASGLTNQVLYVHIYVTNAATLNWQATVRWFTNGLSGSGGAVNGTFASGVYQCGPGTNDYWILATNNFPMVVMTNVTLAMWNFGLLSPSTNCWITAGTKLRAQ